MDIKVTTNTETGEEENVTSNSFTFSSPKFLSDSSYMKFDFNSENNLKIDHQNAFTFANPAMLPVMDIDEDSCGNKIQCKPKSSRANPSVKLFTQAFQETEAFKELKKNSRSETTKRSVVHSITCTKVPRSLLLRAIAKDYFSQFGKISKLSVRPKKETIVIYYTTHDIAKNAYLKCGDYMGEKFNVEWTHFASKSSVKKKPSKDTVGDYLKKPDDEIQLELEAMTNLDYNLHSEPKVKSLENMVQVRKNRILAKNALKPSKTEKSTIKIDKSESENQINNISVPTSTMEELQSIICQAALTSEDKYRILEARDRLMRLKQVKPHSLAHATVTKGTCPDMCPEKERLMRESQRQVASYEQLEGGDYRINHKIAVKQYSRSSADQEEPMPHDLRPVKSLKMTMSYLLHEIADICEEEGANLGEWYHFLWDRTRGIRKDITQQELCCIDSVELVEQCARFHIVCSERLCAEDPSVFDKKINSENLTKCLQSLKYMYHDLRAKGVNCPNEPEFRAYIILLNLNNISNFMWDMQSLPVCIQKSKAVQFALRVYFALESNNYCKFFKLVRETTFLNACILVRYFNQVREKALSIIVKSYTRTATTTISYPVYELIDVLGFEDEDEAIYFSEYLGGTATGDRLYVNFSRKEYLEDRPISKIEQGRARNLVESKRTLLGLKIGRCIAGKHMPDRSYESHEPHNSFDSQGYLLPESIDASDQTLRKLTSGPYEFTEDDELTSTSKFQYRPVERIQSKRPDPPINFADSRNSENAFGTAKNHSAFTQARPLTKSYKEKSWRNSEDSHKLSRKEMSSENRSHHKPKLLVSSSILSDSVKEDNKFSTVTSSSFTSFSKSKDIQNSFSLTQAKSVFSGNAQSNLFSVPATSNLFPQTQSTFTEETSKSFKFTKSSDEKPRDDAEPEKKTELEKKREKEKTEQQRIEQEKKLNQIRKDSENIYDDIRNEVVKDLLPEIVRDELKIATCEKLSGKIFDDIVNQYIQEICDIAINEEQTQAKLNEMSKRMKQRFVSKFFNIWRIKAKRKKERREKVLEDTPVWLQKIPVDEYIGCLYRPEQVLVSKHLRRQMIKPEVSTPVEQTLPPIEAIAYAGLTENSKFLKMNYTSTLFWKLVISWPELDNKILLWQHKKIMNTYLCPENYTTDPIIKHFYPNCYETLHMCIRHFEGFISDRHLIGMDGLLFIASASEIFHYVNRRLTRTVTSRDKLMPLPLVFVVFGTGDLESYKNEIVDSLELLLNSGYISEYTITFQQTLSEKIILNFIQSATLWLAANRASPPPLEMDYLTNVFESSLTQELWLRIYDHSVNNNSLVKALQDPNFIIKLHNEAVINLTDILMDMESSMYNKFSPELKKYLKKEYTLPCTYEYFDDEHRSNEYRVQLEETIRKVNFMLPEWSFPWPITDVSTLRDSINSYCRKTLPEFNSATITCDILSNLFVTTGQFSVSNFIDLFLYIVEKKILMLDGDKRVVYNKNYVKHFQTLPWWYKSNVLNELLRKECISQSRNDEPHSKKKRLEEFEDESFENLDPLAKFCNETQTLVMEVHQLSEEVDKRLKAQQVQANLFEEKLARALAEDADFSI